MKEELLRNLAGILDYVKQGSDFVKEQAPLFIQEFITYKIWFYSFWIITSIVVSIICVYVFKKSYKSYEDFSINYELYFVLIGFSSLILVGMLATFCCCTEELIKAYFAPRYFLMEHLLSLGK